MRNVVLTIYYIGKFFLFFFHLSSFPPGHKPSMASPFKGGGRQGQWNNVRKCISTSRITVVVDNYRESDTYDTLSAFVQDSAHEAFARDDAGGQVCNDCFEYHLCILLLFFLILTDVVV